MKLKYFYKVDQQKKPITASNIRRKSKPPGKYWREILDPCCHPLTVAATGGWRYFVQLDALNKPVDGSLIKRHEYPKMIDEIKYYELDWQNPCCV